MAYNSLLFITLLPIILLGYYLVPWAWRNPLLLAVSVALYMLWWPAGIAVIAWVTMVSYMGIGRLKKHNTRGTLWLTIIATALPLVFFKYLQPLNDTLTQLLHIEWFLNRHRWMIPMGLSFYTLQAIALEVDVAKGKTQHASSLVNHALFMSFFPITTSGPIVRGEELLSQLEQTSRRFSPELAWQGLRWLIWGMFMKVAVAEPFALFVHAAEMRIDTQSGFTLFLSTLCYTIELYADFAGYSLMALGTSALFGIRLRHNFMRPLFSVGIRDFWRRWHISLSTWLRDYIYIPLGGSRRSPWRVRVNVMVTFLFSGLWHGAGWAYVLWGLLHGAWVVVERATHLERWCHPRALRLVVGVITFVMVAMLFMLFNHDIATSGRIVHRILTDFVPVRFTITQSIGTLSREFTMLAMLALMLFKEVRDEWFPTWLSGRVSLQGIFYAVVVLVILVFGVFDRGATFIYMHF